MLISQGLTWPPDKAQTAQPLNLSLVGKIKFPTASHSRNLGTGKFDEGFGAEASKEILKDWTLFTDAYYTILGTPAGADTFRNQFAFDVGAGYQIISPLNLSLFFEQRTAIVAGTSAPRNVNLNAEYQLTHDFRLFGTALAGLSDGSPARVSRNESPKGGAHELW